MDQKISSKTHPKVTHITEYTNQYFSRKDPTGDSLLDATISKLLLECLKNITKNTHLLVRRSLGFWRASRRKLSTCSTPLWPPTTESKTPTTSPPTPLQSTAETMEADEEEEEDTWVAASSFFIFSSKSAISHDSGVLSSNSNSTNEPLILSSDPAIALKRFFFFFLKRKRGEDNNVTAPKWASKLSPPFQHSAVQRHTYFVQLHTTFPHKSLRECVYENNDGRRKHETLKARFLPAYRAFPLPSGVRAFLSRKASLLSLSLSWPKTLNWKMCRYDTFCLQNELLGHILRRNCISKCAHSKYAGNLSRDHVMSPNVSLYDILSHNVHLWCILSTIMSLGCMFSCMLHSKISSNSMYILYTP